MDHEGLRLDIRKNLFMEKVALEQASQKVEFPTLQVFEGHIDVALSKGHHLAVQF